MIDRLRAIQEFRESVSGLLRGIEELQDKEECAKDEVDQRYTAPGMRPQRILELDGYDNTPKPRISVKEMAESLVREAGLLKDIADRKSKILGLFTRITALMPEVGGAFEEARQDSIAIYQLHADLKRLHQKVKRDDFSQTSALHSTSEDLKFNDRWGGLTLFSI